MLTDSDIWTKTHWIKNYMSDYQEKAAKLANDPDKAKRLKTQECVWCFYMPQIGGSAVTASECKGCSKKLLNGSTNINQLCKECACRYGLCRHCSSDMELKIRRKGWIKI